ncbi:unnamed protein product, partial [marine sediment metagenome]
QTLGLDVEQTIKDTRIKLEPKPMLTVEQMAEQIPPEEKISIPMIKNRFKVGEGIGRQVRALWAEKNHI